MVTKPSAPLPNSLRRPNALQTLQYGFDPEGFFADAYRKVGDLFTVRVLTETWVVVGDPAAVKEVLALGPEQANSGEANFALRPLIGSRNVLLADGPEHLARRKLLLPPFHGDRMRAYETTIREATTSTIAAMPKNHPFALLPHMQSLTLSVIMRCIFGVSDEERLAALGGTFRQMLTWVTDMRRGMVFATLGPERLMRLRRFRGQLAAVDRELAKEIALRRDAPDLDQREDILSMLVMARDEAGRGLDDLDLRDELATLLVAGHETTAAILAWAMHELARDPALQDRLAEDEPGLADAIVAETLRLRPPVPIVLRKLRSPATIAGHQLPTGTTLAPCALLVHRRSDLYPEPWQFDPARFADRKRVASEWFPFGGSVRRCVGAAFAQFEARLVLEELVRTLEFSPDRNRSERVGRRGPILVPSRGARVIARSR